MIKFKYKTVYGRAKFYPVDELSITFIELTGKKCLSAKEMRSVLQLMLKGIEVEVEREGEVLTTAEVVSLLAA